MPDPVTRTAGSMLDPSQPLFLQSTHTDTEESKIDTDREDGHKANKKAHEVIDVEQFCLEAAEALHLRAVTDSSPAQPRHENKVKAEQPE